jgi:hypothetical protein
MPDRERNNCPGERAMDNARKKLTICIGQQDTSAVDAQLPNPPYRQQVRSKTVPPLTRGRERRGFRAQAQTDYRYLVDILKFVPKNLGVGENSV